MNKAHRNRKTLVLLSLVFLVLMAAIIIAGKSYYTGLRRAIEKEKTNNLSAVADLKVHQIVQWREARLGEAWVMMESTFFTEGVSRFLADPNNKAARQGMLDQLKAQMKSENYHNIILLNSAGKTMLLANQNSDSPNDISKGFLAKVRDGGQPIMSDLFICRKEGIPHLEIMVPLFERRNVKKHLLGYVNLQIDPRGFLYPTIQGWPTPSKSSEITLTRRENGDVLFLNELRFKKGAALNFKIPVTRSDLPAAMGVLGKEGPVVGFDYRGVKVLAVLRAIPGANWHMVAKIDYNEVFADLLRQEKLILAIMLALIFLTAAVVLTIFLYQRHDFYKSLYIKESERKALQTHYDYLVKYANDIILLMDDQYRIVEANQRAAETYGYKENEMSGMSVNQLRADSSQPFFKVIDGGIASDGHLFETIHRRSDGKTFPAEVSARAITIDNKRFIQAIIRNISERKQYDLDIIERNKELESANQELVANEKELKAADKELRESTRRINILINNLRGVAYRRQNNPTWTMEYISDGIYELAGYQASDFINDRIRSFNSIITKDDRPAAWDEIQKCIKDKNPYTLEYRIHTQDGQQKWVWERGRGVFDDDGSVALEGFIADITGQKMAEQEKKQIESQLFQAHKMEAIGQLAGGIAHDFNNMLAGIMGNAEILAMKLINEPALLGLVERIITSAEHAANLTKQLLSFSRKGKYQMIPVNIHKIVGEVVSILSNTVDRKVRIKQFLKAGQYNILGDPAQLENAFLNLGLNARDAMPSGGELIFSTELADLDKNYLNAHHYKLEPGRYLQISVTDTGTGMDQNTKEHLFEPFFTTKEPGKGTGLGLASVYGIVKNHSGSIEVYSESGHGTTIKIYLPITEVEADKIEPTTKYQDTAGTERILLVDDEEMIRVMASQILTSFGYNVKTCQDGQEAVEYYRENHRQTDLVILDMIMPQLNGREAFAEMKKINPDIKALLSSGFSADGEAQEILKDGVKDFVQKPFRIAELMSKVRKALG